MNAISIDARFLRMLADSKLGCWEPVLRFDTSIPEMVCRVCGDRSIGLDNIKQLLAPGVGCMCDGK